MFNRSLLSDQSNLFISNLVQSGKSRSCVVSITLGVLLASRAQIAVTDNDNSGIFFIQNVKPGIVSALGKLNELIPVDIDAVIEYAVKYYKFRQEQVNGISLPINGFKECAKVEDFFGLTKFFSAEDIELINKSTNDMTGYWVRFQNILQELG